MKTCDKALPCGKKVAVTIENLLMSVCGLTHESAEDGCKGS